MTAFYTQYLLGAQHLLGWTTVFLFGAGVYLLSRQALDLILDVSTGLIGYIRRQLQPRVMWRLLTVIQEDPTRQAVQKQGERISARLLLYSLSRLRVAWIAVGVLAALLLSDAMLSPVALTAILVTGELYRAQLYHQRMGRLNEDVGNLVVQFQSRYPLNRSLVKTLQEAANVLPSGETRSAVESTLARLRMNMATAEAVKPLQSLPHPVMRQLAGLIAEVQDTNQDVFLETLRLLQEEVESKLDLRQQARQSLTLVRGTARILQIVLLAALVAACILPAWRHYFVSSAKNWLLLLSMLAVGALGSLYVEAELLQLEV
ncbi:MAG: hypothetical protein KJ939_08285 [Nanoarchaeota archaeon]|nr:hypothetical protein [Nanoarchaeota archaeon]